MNYWFIEEGTLAPYLAARAAGDRLGTAVSTEKVNEIRMNADKWARAGFASENLSTSNGVARISVSGVLLNSASHIDEMYAHYLGETYTTYPGLMAQLSAAEADSSVESTEIHFATPGGMMEGVDDAARMIASCSKPTKAVIPWMAASAGYYLASQCDQIVASSPSSSVGSIGVVVDIVDTSALYEKWGVKFYSLTSTKAPNKRQEPHSEEFKAAVVDRLDELHTVFASRVAEGRSRATGKTFTEDSVNTDFGRGGLVIAKDALAAGMIDAVENTALNNYPKEDTMAEKETATFTQEEVTSAHEAGVEKERARVTSLLAMGADNERVITAIQGGEELGGALYAELHAAGVQKAKDDAKAEATAEATASEAAAAVAMEEEKVPAVVEGEEGDEKASELTNLRATASKLTKAEPTTKQGED